MSAIAGIVNFQPLDEPIQKYLHQILDRMPHRGSLDEGYALFEDETEKQYFGNQTPVSIRQSLQLSDLTEGRSKAWMGLAHRLGTISGQKSAKAHMPYLSKDGRYWVVFDGEILNASQLAKGIEESLGEVDPHNPGEIISMGYKIWQERILAKIEGTFALVIYDNEEKNYLEQGIPLA